MSINKKEFSKLHSTIKALVDEFGAESSLNLVAFYFEVASGEVSGNQIEQQEVGRRLEISGAAASRNATLLLQYRGPNRPGLNLIDPYEDWEDRRRRYLRLTGHGKNFITKLLRKTS